MLDLIVYVLIIAYRFYVNPQPVFNIIVALPFSLFTASFFPITFLLKIFA